MKHSFSSTIFILSFLFLTIVSLPQTLLAARTARTVSLPPQTFKMRCPIGNCNTSHAPRNYSNHVLSDHKELLFIENHFDTVPNRCYLCKNQINAVPEHVRLSHRDTHLATSQFIRQSNIGLIEQQAILSNKMLLDPVRDAERIITNATSQYIYKLYFLHNSHRKLMLLNSSTPGVQINMQMMREDIQRLLELPRLNADAWQQKFLDEITGWFPTQPPG